VPTSSLPENKLILDIPVNPSYMVLETIEQLEELKE
jgi:hypothetical protein